MSTIHKISLGLLGMAGVVMGVGNSFAAPVKIELPPEGITFQDGPGRELVMTQCLTCHSSEYVTTQPLLPRAAWKASVEKMRAKYGAAIPPEQTDEVINYLVKFYGLEPSAPPKEAGGLPK